MHGISGLYYKTQMKIMYQYTIMERVDACTLYNLARIYHWFHLKNEFTQMSKYIWYKKQQNLWNRIELQEEPTLYTLCSQRVSELQNGTNYFWQLKRYFLVGLHLEQQYIFYGHGLRIFKGGLPCKRKVSIMSCLCCHMLLHHCLITACTCIGISQPLNKLTILAMEDVYVRCL